MLTKTLEVLRSNNIPYEEITHAPSYTAQSTAHAANISGHRIAKSVIVELDGEMIMAVLHGDEYVDMNKLREATGAYELRLVTEKEFLERFPDCEIGALPPFGNLYAMPVIVSSTVDRDNDLVFNPGSHRELVRISYQDFKQLVHPAVLDFASKGH